MLRAPSAPPGTRFLPAIPIELIDTSAIGSRVVYERYRRVRDESP